jgi:hypothetical protein
MRRKGKTVEDSSQAAARALLIGKASSSQDSPHTSRDGSLPLTCSPAPGRGSCAGGRRGWRLCSASDPARANRHVRSVDSAQCISTECMNIGGAVAITFTCSPDSPCAWTFRWHFLTSALSISTPMALVRCGVGR